MVSRSFHHCTLRFTHAIPHIEARSNYWKDIEAWENPETSPVIPIIITPTVIRMHMITPIQVTLTDHTNILCSTMAIPPAETSFAS